ncbi:MAG: transketolase [Burkholderiaceae bacterium]
MKYEQSFKISDEHSINGIESSKLANALRILAAETVENAKSGHPGMPLGMAEIAVALWSSKLKHNPLDPNWVNRDRFVLSNGHGSMLIYSLLHLTGYDLSIDDLKKFRKLGSKTPGHPEVDITPGVETTTGPLGQGLANGVGMALAEKMLSSEFNRPGYPIIDHFTYVFLGDGCLMEGVSHEVCSLAGVLKLSKLICFYDSNNISIDGQIDPWFKEDIKKRFEGYGWNVIGPVDGHNIDEITCALNQAINNHKSRDENKFAPTLIICKTIIGKGAPKKEGTAKAHGEALGTEELNALKSSCDWEHTSFEIPKEIMTAWNAHTLGQARQDAWNHLFESYKAEYPQKAQRLIDRCSGKVDKLKLNNEVNVLINQFLKNQPNIATRKSSQKVLNFLGPRFDFLLGGSADLTGSNLTQWEGSEPVRLIGSGKLISGRHINFGVREFGMFSICNGISLHGGFVPYNGTFLTFSDYGRNAIRMAAMMRKRVIFVFTHDSIGLGEDGPTHQAVEHISSLRLIPNLNVWRPCDPIETAIAWKEAILCNTGPTALLFSRQSLDPAVKKMELANRISRGGYTLSDVNNPQIILISTGSEVGLAVKSAEELSNFGIRARVVSIPSTSVFDKQKTSYKESVLPSQIPKVVIEAGVTDFWWKYQPAAVLGVDQFGESAPAKDVFEHFGFTVKSVTETVSAVLGIKIKIKGVS